MKTIKRLSHKKSTAISLVVSFVLPLSMLLLCFCMLQLAPFGSKTLCSMDGFSQYYPMLMNMKQSLKEGELFYSFSGALGFNLWAQSAYYTNSPFWLLLYLVPDSMNFEAIHFIILIKFCLASVFFCLWLLKMNPDSSYTTRTLLFPAFSFAYALSGYMVAFINQFMWTDVVMLLPLVVLGIDMLVQKRKPYLYIASLALSIWSCFYLSYMVCIFAVLYFIFSLLKQKREKEQIISAVLYFGISSLLAGALCAVSLIPTAKALSLTAASESGFDADVSVKHTLFEFIRQLLPFANISLEYGEPNLYCSFTAVIAMIFFFFSKKISLRERLLSLALVTFISFTMCINLGEYVWHGFHFPNQLPARQSFLLIFLILSLGAKGIEKSSISNRLNIAISFIVIIGISLTSSYQLLTQTWISRINSLEGNAQRMENLAAMDDNDIFSRLEWSDEKKNNYPQQYHYNGICYYSSTMQGNAWNFFQGLGMERYAKNVSTHYNGSAILNSLFGIKYVLDESGNNVRENSSALSIAYLSDEEVLNFSADDYDSGKKAQRALLKAIQLDKNEPQSKALKHLKENELVLTYFDTDVIQGNITCERDGVFLTTLPYDCGWEIIIDGEKQQTQNTAGYLTSCSITRGEHTVEMRYTVPGIKLGAVISFSAVLALAVFVVVLKKKEK